MGEINKEKIGELFDKFIKNAEEERDLALERYRRQDILIETAEDFVLQGKNVVDFLKTASQRSDSLLEVAKLMINMDKDSSGGGGGSSDSSGDDIKKKIKEAIDSASDGV